MRANNSLHHLASTQWGKWLNQHRAGCAGIGLVAFYIASRLLALTSLPIFADEAIYIRWAQLITHSAKYWYFALNDGKPPLFIWSLLPALLQGGDPLGAARAVAALVGLGQLWISDRLLVRLGGQRAARFVQALIIIMAPFWFFHHRMALMDGMLTFFLTLSVWGLVTLHQQLSDRTIPPKSWSTILLAVVAAGLGWGLALWTKIPALFMAPLFPLLAYGGWWLEKVPLHRLQKWQYWWARTWYFGLAGALGLAVFLLLKTQPNFGSLFSRGNDFSFTMTEVLQGQWHTSLDNVGRLLRWLSAYLRPELLSLITIAALLSRRRRWHWALIAGAAIMALPLLIMGRTLHPRYFLPMALFLTPSAALFTAEVLTFVRTKADRWLTVSFYLVGGFFFIASARFMLLSYFTPDQTPFVLEDRTQYLTEWSSGHGLTQIRDRLLQRAHQNLRTTVVTEGSFGTLPDGLLLYFDRRPEIAWLRIEGLAQYPVKFLPTWVTDLAQTQEVWLVVNENRLELPTAMQPNLELLGRYSRPYGAPDLLLFRIRPLLPAVGGV